MPPRPQRYPAPDLGGRLAAAGPSPATTVTRVVESLPGNIFRSFQKFLTGH